MIHHVIPWANDKNIGKFYNESMERIGESDWCCFIDGDAVHTTPYFGKRIEQVIQENPGCGFFTCYTNRVYCKWQTIGLWQDNDMANHRGFGESLWALNGTDCVDATNWQPMSGVLMLVSKRLWRKVKFTNGILGVDNAFHKAVKQANERLFLMKGIYVYHWYRGGDIHNTNHLK